MNQWLGLLGLLGLLGVLSSRSTGGGRPAVAAAPPTGGGAPPDRSDGQLGHRAYVDSLYAQQRELLPGIRPEWGLWRLRAVALAAADWMTSHGYPVDPAQLWGLTYRESHWVPIGVHGVYGPPSGWPSRTPEVSYKSSAYGLTQLLRSRFDAGPAPWSAERLGGLVFWDHPMLLWPRLAVWTTAVELARLYERLGRLPSNLNVGQWWACPAHLGRAQADSCAGARAKADSISAAGGEVYAGASPSAFETSNVPGPPPQPTDGLPPTAEDWWA